MARHGCRIHGISRLHASDFVRFWLVLSLSLIAHFTLFPASALADETATLDMRLEFTWTSSQPRVWAGELSISGDAELRPEPGRLSEPGNLTSGMLMTGGVYLTPENDCLKFAPPPTIGQLRTREGKFVLPESTNGGVSFRVRGKGAERLIIALRRDGSLDLTAPVAISLQDLADGKPITSQFNAVASWTVRRRDGDRLRVTLVPVAVEPAAVTDNSKPSTSLFWDDEKARVSISTDLPIAAQLDAYELVCDTLVSGSLALASQTWALEAGSSTGEFKAIDAQWQPPRTEGGYRLRWRLQKRSTTRSVMGVSMPMNLSDSLTYPMTLIRGTSDERVIAESFTDVVVLARQNASQPSGEPFASPNDSLASLGRLAPFGRTWSVSRLVPLRQVTQFASTAPQNQARKANVAGKQVAEISPGAHWTHALPTSKPGTRHRLKITIPDSKSMRLGICVIDRIASNGKNTVIRDVTSIRTRLDSTSTDWATIEVDYYPLSGSPQIVIINRDPAQPLQFEGVDVLAAVSADVAAASNQPGDATIGQVTNLQTADDTPWNVQLLGGAGAPSVPLNAASRRALMHVDMDQWLRLFGSIQEIDPQTNAKQFDIYTAASRLIEAIKRERYRGVVMTVCESGQTLFPTSSMTASPSPFAHTSTATHDQTQSLEILLRMFDREGLTFIPCVRPNFPMTKLERAVAAGAIGRGIALTPVWNSLGIDLSLREFESCHSGIYNPTHDQVAEQVVELVNEVALLCSGHECVDTIGVLGDEGSCLNLPAKREMLDSASLDRFHASLPAGAPARSQMMAWVANEGSAAFDDWRAGCLRSLYARMALQVGRHKKSLMALSTRDALPIERLVTENGAPILYTRLYRRSPLETLADRCRNEQVAIASAVNKSGVAGDAHPESWLNAALYLAPSPQESLRLGYQEVVTAFELDSPQPHADITTDPLATALAISKSLSRSDRTSIGICASVALSGDAVTRRSLTRFNALPPVAMEDVVPADEAMKLVKLRKASFGGMSYLAVMNHSRWPMSASVMVTASGRIEPLITDDGGPRIDPQGAWQVQLAPGELAAVRVRDPNAKVRAWTANVDGGAAQVAAIGKSVREWADAVAIMTEPKPCDCIENASFEAGPAATAGGAATDKATSAQPDVSNQNQVAGWLLAQHPASCATLDNEVAQDGKHSIRLRNLEGRPGGTWIVSRQIATPATGRLAVSLMLRGQPSEDASKTEPILVRVAIEGNVAGSAMRQAEVFRVPRDGKWSQTPCRVEVDLLPRCGVESLRLAIDVMNEGTVWIDSVRAEDSFMTETERSQLQSQMFLALSGIGKGELSHAAKLLESHWVQQMLAGVAEPPRPAILQTSESLDTIPANGNKETTENTAPGIAERLKGWIPRPIRF
jgi:hypothetical protein